MKIIIIIIIITINHNLKKKLKIQAKMCIKKLESLEIKAKKQQKKELNKFHRFIYIYFI